LFSPQPSGDIDPAIRAGAIGIAGFFGWFVNMGAIYRDCSPWHFCRSGGLSYFFYVILVGRGQQLVRLARIPAGLKNRVALPDRRKVRVPWIQLRAAQFLAVLDIPKDVLLPRRQQAMKTERADSEIHKKILSIFPVAEIDRCAFLFCRQTLLETTHTRRLP